MRRVSLQCFALKCAATLKDRQLHLPALAKAGAVTRTNRIERLVFCLLHSTESESVTRAVGRGDEQPRTILSRSRWAFDSVSCGAFLAVLEGGRGRLIQARGQ